MPNANDFLTLLPSSLVYSLPSKPYQQATTVSIFIGYIEQAKTFAITQELQFAEKLHTYTFPWQGRVNTREKDLIDMVIYIGRGMDPEKLRQRVEAVFVARASHQLPAELNRPPSTWGKVFDKMAAELEYPGTTSRV